MKTKINEMKKCLFTLALITVCSFFAHSQIISNKTVYLNFSAGLSRSEDGLAFLVIESANQVKPMFNVGVGYRLNKNIAFELNWGSMISPVSAKGTLLSNNQQAVVEAINSNIIVSPVILIPFSTKSEIFLKLGGGLLFSQTKIASSSNPNFKQSTNTGGYLVGLGYNRRLTNKLVSSAQFDFSDKYGNKNVWTGDVGFLHIGIRYSFNDKNQ